MKAFKTISQAPAEQQPDGLDTSWPWQVQDCEAEDQAALEALNFTVLSDEDYADYLAARQEDYDEWLAAQPPVLEDVSPRQIRLALVMGGIPLASIDAILDAMSEPDRSLAIIEWQHALAFKRNNPLVISVGAALELTSEDIDAIWLVAMGL